MVIKQIRFALTLGLVMAASCLSTGFSGAQEVPGEKSVAAPGSEAMKAEKSIAEALANLTADDRRVATAQRFCPVMEYQRLGAMGTPVKVLVEGKPVFVCCKDCVADAVKKGKETLAKAQRLTSVSAVLAKLTPETRAAAELQKYCAVIEGSFLGGMGAPIQLTLNGKSVFVCCTNCVAKAQSDPAGTIARVESLQKAGKSNTHDHEGQPTSK